MTHPIRAAALAAGFLDAGASTAHPFDGWREALAGRPLGRVLSIEHRPEVLCGWPLRETTIWSAVFAAPPFASWPEGFGTVSHYYMRSQTARGCEAVWAEAARGLGFEVLAGAPLPQRAAAIRAGLGVPGLMGPLITRRGSFVGLAALLVRARPPAGTPGPERDLSPGCERCGLCAAACPVGAISERGVDAVRCLRYDMGDPAAMPEAHREPMGRRILGCEACQRACPRNRGVAPVAPAAGWAAPFGLEGLLSAPDLGAIAALIGRNYARKGRIQTQAALAAANSGRRDLLPSLERLADSAYAPLRGAARWAARRLRETSAIGKG